MISVLLVMLAGALAFIFGWNNSSLLIGNIRASGSFSTKGAVVLSVLGLLAGSALEGPQMLKSLNGSVGLSAPETVLAVTFLVSIAFTVGMTLLRLPATFSGIMLGSFLGASLEAKVALNVGQVALIVSFWFVGPAVAGVVAFVLRKVVSTSVSGLSLVSVDSFNRASILVASLAVAFVLGANNIGLIAGTSVGSVSFGTGALIASLMACMAALGAVLLGKGRVSDTIGDKMLSLSPQGVFAVFAGAAISVIIGTQLQVPMSMGQSVLGGMFGAAYSQQMTVINRRVAGVTLGVWLVTPLMALAVAFIVGLV